jgi:hypothetical protein
MGLEGYRHQLPVIEQHPSFLPPENLVKYENMPMDAEHRALAMRGAWIDRHVGSATETFSKLVVTSADIDLLLRAIEADQSLVHAAYYTDDECIARVADWIAGRGMSIVSSCKSSWRGWTRQLPRLEAREFDPGDWAEAR